MTIIERLKAPITALALFLAMLVSPVAANATDDETAAMAFIQSMTDRAIGILADKELDEDAKLKAFDEVLSNDVDMQSVAYFVLGRHRRSLEEAQLEEYVALYQDYLIVSNASRLGLYSGESLKVTKATALKRGQYMVNSVIERTDGGPDIRIDWRVRNRDGAFKVLDIVIEGISMAASQRDEFGALISKNRGDMEPLFDRMRRVIDGTEPVETAEETKS